MSKKGEKDKPENDWRLTVLSGVGEMLWKILKDRIGSILKKHEIKPRATGLRPSHCCVEHMHTFSEVIEDTKYAVLPTSCFFDVHKVMTQYNGIGCRKRCGKQISEERGRKLWQIWRCARSAVMLTGKYPIHCLYFTKGCTRIYTITRYIYVSYSRNDWSRQRSRKKSRQWEIRRGDGCFWMISWGCQKHRRVLLNYMNVIYEYDQLNGHDLPMQPAWWIFVSPIYSTCTKISYSQSHVLYTWSSWKI